jgi:DNA-directed RNA polymerase specialized sigma24 family protein
MILTETRAMLLSMIRKLEHRHQRVLLLNYFHGLTASQIAAKLNLPMSNIAARICSARQKLHSLLCCNSAWRRLRAELRDQFPAHDTISPKN